MTDLPRPKMHDVHGKIRAAIHAHKAVTDNVAPHAAEAVAMRDAKLAALETHNKLTGVSKP
jgi:hypothetical protein